MEQNRANPLVSVIVPIYNSEKFLEAALESIAVQTYRNIEIILVNDGSTDKSLDICKKFLKLETRSQLFTQKNSGVAAARNLGLSKATGDYIIHVDSDDISPPRSIELLVETALKEDSDIVVGSYVMRFPDKDILVEPRIKKSSSSFLESILKDEVHAGLWNKLIHRRVYSGIEITPNLDLMEDKLLLVKMLCLQERKISAISETIYIYYQRANSISYSPSSKNLEQSEMVVSIICELTTDKVSKELINSLKYRNRIMILLFSEKPQQKYNPAVDHKILSDRGIPSHIRLIIFFISRGVIFPQKIYIKLRKIYYTHTKLFNS